MKRPSRHYTWSVVRELAPRFLAGACGTDLPADSVAPPTASAGSAGSGSSGSFDATLGGTSGHLTASGRSGAVAASLGSATAGAVSAAGGIVVFEAGGSSGNPVVMGGAHTGTTATAIGGNSGTVSGSVSSSTGGTSTAATGFRGLGGTSFASTGFGGLGGTSFASTGFGGLGGTSFASTGFGGVGATRSGTSELGGTSTGNDSTFPRINSLPSKASILDAVHRANDFFVARWPDPTLDIVSPDRTRPSNLWTRALYFEGLMALYAIEPLSTKRNAYYNYAVAWGSTQSHPWTMTYTSAGVMTNNADNQACGQTYLDLYRIDPRPERIATIKANIDDMVTKKTVNVWTWIDAIQMSMPVFAKLGAITQDTKYFDAMWSLYEYSRNQRGGGLFNTQEGLWWRDYHFTPGGGVMEPMTSTRHNAIPSSSTDSYIVSPNGENLFWSRGNGWVIAALVRVLDELPLTDPHRNQYVADYLTMANALLPLQSSSGFWSESLRDSNHCSAIGIPAEDSPETSGTALFVYGLAWGVRHGLLDASTFGDAIRKGWNGLVSVALQSNGLLGYVQNTGDRPCTGPAPLGPTTLANFDDYGVGCFLLAGSEIYQLSSN